MDLLRTDSCGLWCEEGGFYVDPWGPVDRAVITHAHSEHARRGCGSYLTALPGEALLRERLGEEAVIRGLPYGDSVNLNGVDVSFHPAGHLLGSAQVRIEHLGEVWVVGGDYKLQADPTCEPFEAVKCHVFLTESTYGSPCYRWPSPDDVFREINEWWAANQQAERTSVLLAYPLGKAERLLAGVDSAIGPIAVHASIDRMLPAYVAAGVQLPEAPPADRQWLQAVQSRGLVLAPPSVLEDAWLDRFAGVSTAFASGWMLGQGVPAGSRLDRGFVLSDHADWDALQMAIRESGAERVGVMHGCCEPLLQWLTEEGWEAWPVATCFTSNGDDEGERVPAGIAADIDLQQAAFPQPNPQSDRA